MTDLAVVFSLLGLALNAVIVVFVMLGYFRRFATKDDIKDLSDRLVNVENRLGNVEAGQAALETGLGNVEAGQAALENRLSNVEAGQAALENRQAALETRLGNVEAGQAALETRLGNVEAGQAALENRQAALETRISSLDGNIRENGKKASASLELHHAVRGDLKVLQASVNRLESYFETPKLKSS